VGRARAVPGTGRWGAVAPCPDPSSARMRVATRSEWETPRGGLVTREAEMEWSQSSSSGWPMPKENAEWFFRLFDLLDAVATLLRPARRLRPSAESRRPGALNRD
jgi:hypothetical protein